MPRHGIHDTAPATRWEDAYLSGNGRHGALVHGRTDAETVVVTHHDLVLPDAASGVEPPALAGELPAVQDLLLAGEQAEAVRRFGGDWEPRYVQPFHPGFAVSWVRSRREEVTEYRRELDFRTGVVTTRWREGGGEWLAECFVSRADDVVVQRLVAPEGAAVEAEIGLDGRLPGAPDGLRAAVRSVYRPAEIAAGAELPRDTALLRLRARYPDSSYGYRGAARIVATGGTVRCDGPRVYVSGAAELLVLTRTARGEIGPPASELSRLDTGMYRLPADHRELLARHVALHGPAYDRVGLDLGAPEEDRQRPVAELLERQSADPSVLQPALLEALFAAGRYHLLSASGALPPRLCGLWTGDWHTAWGGAFTTNANLNLQIASAATGDLPEATHALAALVRGQLTDWRTNARLLYGTRGVVAPAHTDGTNGLQYHFNHSWAHHLWTAGADWLLQPLVEYVETSGDLDFLRTELLPLLAEVADFYADFLTRTDPDGTLVLVPSYSPENHPTGPDGTQLPAAASINATMDLAAARHALLTAADLTELHTDASGAHWRTVADRLPDYRVNADGALAEWAWPSSGDTYDHRHVSHLYPVWPLDEISPDTTPALAEAARTALLLRGDENHSGHGHLHRALAAARLDDPVLTGRQLSQLLIRDFYFRSLMSSHYPDRNVYNADVAHALPAVLIELLLRSHPATATAPARLVLLPALPDALPHGSLYGLRTRFGAVVRSLSWTPAAVTVVLCSPVDQELTVRSGAVGKHAPVRLLLTAGEERTVRFDR
ncbi:glycoside hydrolase N-terminal domain-containing protein [Kitasatospora sp. CMC57]|uniref:Glycoside hydrolase N-terminal domain-containing protein n=1 Tax=Kitasatospora sp. CMC57 TaxID=3231513 RepID=A0AB33K1N1_9ACTN